MSYMPKIVRLIRRRTLAYELLAEYDADNLPFDSERYARGCEAILSYSKYAAGVSANPSGAARWNAAVAEHLARTKEGAPKGPDEQVARGQCTA